jgi:hypothetical protein
VDHPFGAYEATIFRAICVGTLVGAVVFAVGMTAIAMWVGVSFEAAVVLGAFTAFWGGAGFGGMFGAIMAARRHELEEKVEATTPVPIEQQRHDLAA